MSFLTLRILANKCHIAADVGYYRCWLPHTVTDEIKGVKLLSSYMFHIVNFYEITP